MDRGTPPIPRLTLVIPVQTEKMSEYSRNSRISDDKSATKKLKRSLQVEKESNAPCAVDVNRVRRPKTPETLFGKDKDDLKDKFFNMKYTGTIFTFFLLNILNTYLEII